MNTARAVLLYDFALSICCQMTRLVLAEKGVSYEKRNVDIAEKREQFEGWYVALNPKGVVPTLVAGDEVVTDTLRITPWIDEHFDGPELQPAAPSTRDQMREWMNALMAPRYGVLLYSRNLNAQRESERMKERLAGLLELRERAPESAPLLDVRIASNRRLQAVMRDADQVDAELAACRQLMVRLSDALVGRDFVVGEHWTLADAFATAAIARFELHGYSSWWAAGALPALEAYYNRMQARPSWGQAGVHASA